MKRYTSIILSILLGAVAVGIGMGIFLKKANDDRTRLATVVDEAQKKSAEAIQSSQQAIQDANQKLASANDEVQKAQDTLRAVAEERELLGKAQALTPPPTRAIKGWKEAVDLPLGVSLKFPLTSDIENIDAQALTLAFKSQALATTSSTPEDRWFSLTPYDERLESELISTLATSTPSIYSVGGRLLIGSVGWTTDDAQHQIYVLHVQSLGQTTHLIWARTSSAREQNDLLQTLATLTFQN